MRTFLCILFCALFLHPVLPAENPGEGTRIAYFVPSTHWDREWYEPFQGFRMRLVSMMDELFDVFEKDPEFKKFFMDGQVAPVYDYLEIRPERQAMIEGYIRSGRLKVGPWFVLPDEWLIGDESFIRNIQMGQRLAKELGAPASTAGFACDMFGHIGQLPQLFDQLGVRAAFVWRGTHEKEHGGNFFWKAPDGTLLPTFRFSRIGYCTYCIEVRDTRSELPFNIDASVDRLVRHIRDEAARTPVSPILLFDGGDHLEIEPQTSTLLARANERLRNTGFKIIHDDMDAYIDALLKERDKITKTFEGEFRESSRDPGNMDEQWLIPGVLSSRIHLKQKNAQCEDELSLWAEPFSAFAASLDLEYPVGYLNTAWRFLLLNHPHDSMCGCSIDQVHQDMLFRFDQSYGISSRLAKQALRRIAIESAPANIPPNSLLLAVFNATSEDINESIDLDIPLPTSWKTTYQEFFGYERKFAFRLYNAFGEEIPYQLVGQDLNRNGFSRDRYKFPRSDVRNVVHVCAPLSVPAFGYTTVLVKAVEGPTRHLGSMAVSHREIENEYFKVKAENNGTVSILDKRSARTYADFLTFEDRADIGDGWYHGVAVNDQVYVSSASGADVGITSDGIGKATLRISVTMNVPGEFDFKEMKRSSRMKPLSIVSDITLRRGADRIEIATRVENTVKDHRVRVLFPTELSGNTYYSDSAFDVVERPVALKEDNNIRRELDVETRPQIRWTAFGDGKNGIAVVSRGLPESAVIDEPSRPIALTLFRAFRRAVFSNDNPGGQIQGTLSFRYDIVPYSGDVPSKKLFLAGQRVNVPVKTVDLLPRDIVKRKDRADLPRRYSFLNVIGNAVVTSVQKSDNALLIRLFNPERSPEEVSIEPGFAVQSAKSVQLNGAPDVRSRIIMSGNRIEMAIPPKRIATILIQ